MDLEEHTLKDTMGERCEVCGATLTEAEIVAGRESTGAFLCTVHAAEELPVEPAPDSPEGGNA